MIPKVTTVYTPVELDRKSEDEKMFTLGMLTAGVPDQQIRKALMDTFRFGSEVYAQNIIDWVRENPNLWDW